MGKAALAREAEAKEASADRHGLKNSALLERSGLQQLNLQEFSVNRVWHCAEEDKMPKANFFLLQNLT